jgi:hypothetical protein
MPAKSKINLMVILIVASAVTIRCQQEVALPRLPYEERVVIQGIMEPDSLPIIYFNRTVPYLSGTTDPAALVIRDCKITIHSATETEQLNLDSVFLPMDCRYNFFYKGNLVVRKDITYTLHIVHGEKTYTATTTTALKPVTIDKVTYTPAFKDLYGEHEGVITYFRDIPGEENYYRFQMTRKADRSTRDVTGNNRDLLIPCIDDGDTIIVTELGRSVYNDKNLQDQQVKLIIEPAYTHEIVVTIFVRIQTIDKGTYDFYSQLDGQKLSQYNPFVEPYFINTGQFGDDAIGYFGTLVRSEEVRFEMPLDD